MNLRFKTNNFNSYLRQNINFCLIIQLGLILFFFVQISAQPTGKCNSRTLYSKDCRGELTAMVNYLTAQLNDLDEKISREPKNADLYYQRAGFYTNIMYNIAGLGFKDVKFDGKVYFSEIDAKAVADFTRAINLSPKSEYYENRGRVYASYWEREIPAYFYLNGAEKKSKEEILKNVEQLFLNNEHFKAAESDFQKAVKISPDYEASKKAREKLFSLYARRSYELGRSEYVAKIIGSEEAANVALADYDRLIDYYKTLAAGNKPAWIKDSVDFQINLRGENQSLYDSLLAKSAAAISFGKDTIALESLNQAEKYQYNQSSDCRVYANRADFFLKRGNFESALRDITTALKSGNLNCRGIVKLRGDAYLLAVDRRRAVSDYTAFLAADFGKGDKETLIKRGKIYLNLGEFEKAAADFSLVIDSDPLCEKNYRLRAQAYRSAGNVQAAQTDEENVQETLKRQKNYQPSDYCSYLQQ